MGFAKIKNEVEAARMPALDDELPNAFNQATCVTNLRGRGMRCTSSQEITTKVL
jgi:hypothetical protein